MPSAELERLAGTGLLEREPPIRDEFRGLLREAAAVLNDAKNAALSPESRFTLAYQAAHAAALAALRWHGYRPRNRQIVFQSLAHTMGTPAPVWRMLTTAHAKRNEMQYEGISDVDERLLKDLIKAAGEILDALRKLAEPPER